MQNHHIHKLNFLVSMFSYYFLNHLDFKGKIKEIQILNPLYLSSREDLKILKNRNKFIECVISLLLLKK